MNARRAFIFGFAATLGGVVAVSLGGLAISDARPEGAQGDRSLPNEKPLSTTLAVFSAPQDTTDVLPAAAAAELRTMAASAPSNLPERLRLGTLSLGKSRLLLTELGPHRARLYAAPTASGKVCMVFTGGPSGCEGEFAVAPIGWMSFDPDRIGAGEPFTVFGLVPNDVRRIEVVESGVPMRALLKNNAFYYRLSDATAPPEAIIVTFQSGRTETITTSFSLPKPPAG